SGRRCSVPSRLFHRKLPGRSRLAVPAEFELPEAWRKIRAALKHAVEESTFEIWLASLEAREFNGEVLIVQAPAATRAWIAERFGRILQCCAAGVLGDRVRVELASDQSGHRAGRREPVPQHATEQSELSE